MNLADPVALKAFLSKHGLWARKGLGQHFLVSPKVVAAITGALQDSKGILEIGPGPGVLTSPLSETAEQMIALEVDRGMIAALADSAPKAKVMDTDALVADIGSILRDLPEPRGVVSNLPYYITGPLLTKIASEREDFSKAVLMMQKEVADRVVAKPKTPSRGSLSVFLQLQFEIKLLVNAPAGAFMPPPKVDSAVLEFRPKKLSMQSDKLDGLFKLIRYGFAQPRKTLINNLVSGACIDRATASTWVTAAGLTPTARPQELSNDQWITLYETNLSA